MVSKDYDPSLLNPISNDEIREVAFELGAMKALRPDGFSGLFYQHAWSTMGE